ncbi:hypothetical protein ACOI22_03220 [Glaciecola sp. 2405UD65-10]|uniref:hypothetical protein n=1 Tax=Glaciecola sp. 2405UD65-10 TaxID=3397244 RepID=UPI003B5A0550
MLKVTNTLFKRSIILSAFLLCFACTDNSEYEKSSEDSPEPPNHAVDVDGPPLLSLSELLSAQDVKLGLAESAAIDDEGGLIYWQNMLLEAADEVNLRAKERKLISGKQGRLFLKFQGMKTNYQTEFESAFVNFEDLNAVYAKYPAFKDLQEQSKALVIKRDALIANMANDLSVQGFEGNAVAEAKRRWQDTLKNL